MWSASMLVTTAITGCRCRNEASDSSASTTMNSPAPSARVRAGRVQAPADDEGRIEPALGEHARDQAGGGGLAVRAGDRDALLQAHQLGEHQRARHDRDALRARRDDLGLSALHRGGDHHRVGAFARSAALCSHTDA